MRKQWLVLLVTILACVALWGCGSMVAVEEAMSPILIQLQKILRGMKSSGQLPVSIVMTPFHGAASLLKVPRRKTCRPQHSYNRSIG